MTDRKVMERLSLLLFFAAATMFMLFCCVGCQQAENGQGLVLSPAGEVAVSVASLYVPEPWRTLGLLLLGSGVGGGAVVGVKKLRKK